MTKLASGELEITHYQFWQSVWIWISKPHVVNKYLFGPKILGVFRCLDDRSLNEIIGKLERFSDTEPFPDTERNLFNFLSLGEGLSLQPCSENDVKTVTNGCFLLIRRLLFKNTTLYNPIDICFINYTENQVLFYHVAPKSVCIHPSIVSFALQFLDKKMEVQILNHSRPIKCEWIEFALLPKLVKWAKESDDSLSMSLDSKRSSLNLIASDRYNELYIMWKEKYGKELVQNWSENTDPAKFVYEDIAIAVYLSLLWGNEKVNFVDLGCGNGLLVYILSQEGHRGHGIDVRSRRIWSAYPPSTVLLTGTVTPEDNCFFPDADWLIGNHSDELTPWIPIFAARSSARCKFFLLPCCAFELSGQKFQRRNSACSTYNDYIDYITEVCEELGFDVSVDRLRIPSTKRICLIGKRSPTDDVTLLADKVENVLSKYQNKNFVPRDAVERVRNCTKIDRSITTRICDTISKMLIERQLALAQSTDVWSTNYSLKFEEAVRLLDPTDLKKLKHECGGLQTLLRNNHSVFKVHGGRIYFRKPDEKKCDVQKWKSKPCWFHNNHPMKCPLPENKCSFLH